MQYQVTIGDNIFEIEADSPQDALDICWTVHDLRLTVGEHQVHISAGIHKYCADVYFDKDGVMTRTRWGFVQ